MSKKIERTITPNPPADYTPPISQTNNLKPFRVWCQKVLPLVYSDELSYYELLCKVVEYLNLTMENVNTMQEDFTALHAAYVQLQDYVNNYFASLDVQEEINNKLDELVEDGTIPNLLANILKSNYPKIVSSVGQMTDHNQIYVLESNGNLYYWNGTAWTNSGITYGVNPNMVISIERTANTADLNDLHPNTIAGYYEGDTPANAPSDNWMGNVITLRRAPVDGSNISGSFQIAMSKYGELAVRTSWGVDNVWRDWEVFHAPMIGMDTPTLLVEGTDLNDLQGNTIRIANNGADITNAPYSPFSGVVMTVSTSREGFLNTRTGMFQIAIGISNQFYIRSTFYYNNKAQWRPWMQVLGANSPQALQIEYQFEDCNELKPNTIATVTNQIPVNSPTPDFRGTVYTLSGILTGQWGYTQVAISRYNQMFYRVCWTIDTPRWDTWKQLRGEDIEGLNYKFRGEAGVYANVPYAVERDGLYLITVNYGITTGNINFYPSGDTSNYVTIRKNEDSVILRPKISGYLNAFCASSWSGDEVSITVKKISDGFRWDIGFSDFDTLKSGSIAYNSSSTPAHAPTSNWLGTVITLSPLNRDDWGAMQIAIDRYNNMHYRVKWTVETAKWDVWKSYVGKMEKTNVTVNFTKARQSIQLQIACKKGKMYRIGVESGLEGMPHDNFIRVLGSNSTASWATIIPNKKYGTLECMADGYLYAYSMSQTAVLGQVTFSVEEVDPNNGGEWIIGAGQEYTSFTRWCLDYENDYSKKIAHLRGDFDIFKEYQDAEMPVMSDTSSENPSTGYWWYNAKLPNNSKIVGDGNVTIYYTPTPEQVGLKQSQCVSPINTTGNNELENVTVICGNGRYCIHDDTLGISSYFNTRIRMKNVRCIKLPREQKDGQYLGYSNVYGAGWDCGKVYEFVNCYFENKTSNRAFYGHTRGKDITSITQSPQITMRNCIFNTSNPIAIFFGNGNTIDGCLDIKVELDSCWIGGSIKSADESNNNEGTFANNYEIRLLNCNIGAKDVTILGQNKYQTVAYNW